MSTPTTASGWVHYTPSASATTLTGQTYTNTIGTYFSSSGNTVYGNTATGSQSFSQFRPNLSTDQMIRQLEYDGHVVLKKQRVAIVKPAKWADTSFLANQADLSMGIHYGFALPEKEGDYLMPDGSTLKVDNYGNYQVLDQDAKVTYKANRIREFSPFINASDLLEKFVGYVGTLGLDVKQTEVLQLPIEAFVNWLILQAALKDGDSLEGLPSVEKALPAPIPKKPRCLGCGRFMSRAWAATRISFCSQDHWSRYQQKRLSYG